VAKAQRGRRDRRRLIPFEPKAFPAITTRTVVLVEGASDQFAVEALAGRQGRDLTAEGIAVVAMGGATNFKRHVEFFGPRGLDVALAGLVDQSEAHFFQRALEAAGLGEDITLTDLERLGFFVCVKDLEDELIRALGPPAVERLLERHGDLHSYRIFQNQPAQRDRTEQARLRRFMGTRGGRKHQYASLLVDELELSRVPEPLDRLLAHIAGSG
jgi:hypothetical protein